MIDLEQPNLLRLYNIDEEIRDALKSAVIRIQPHLEQISDANDYSEFRWKDPVWNHVASMISLLFNLCGFEIESVPCLVILSWIDLGYSNTKPRLIQDKWLPGSTLMDGLVACKEFLVYCIIVILLFNTF